MTSPIDAFTHGCDSGHLMNNQRKCLLSDYGEEVKRLGSDYVSPKHILFIITKSLCNLKDFRVSWPILL